MFRTWIAIVDGSWVWALALVLAGWATGAVAQQPTQLRINVGCPSITDPNFRNYTAEELNRLCYGTSGAGEQAEAAEDGAILTCGQHRAIAAAGRINTGYIEGQAAQQVVDEFCDGPGLADESIPAGSIQGGDQLQGSYRFERGYFTQWTGAKAQICQTYYSGNAFLDRGVITFTSGGHTWTGTITQNSFISITRDGVVPRPKNFTVISGPILDAKLYNGYCGEGFFRLIL